MQYQIATPVIICDIIVYILANTFTAILQDFWVGILLEF
jgi:hypothetical protein